MVDSVFNHGPHPTTTMSMYNVMRSTLNYHRTWFNHCYFHYYLLTVLNLNKTSIYTTLNDFLVCTSHFLFLLVQTIVLKTLLVDLLTLILVYSTPFHVFLKHPCDPRGKTCVIQTLRTVSRCTSICHRSFYTPRTRDPSLGPICVFTPSVVVNLRISVL